MSELLSFEQRAELLLSRVYGGMHHVHSLKKTRAYWTCIHAGDMASYDFDVLTRLVFAAHEFCCRVQLANGGPRGIKVWVHPRKREGENPWERHPTIEQALERWKGVKP